MSCKAPQHEAKTLYVHLGQNNNTALWGVHISNKDHGAVYECLLLPSLCIRLETNLPICSCVWGVK